MNLGEMRYEHKGYKDINDRGKYFKKNYFLRNTAFPG